MNATKFERSGSVGTGLTDIGPILSVGGISDLLNLQVKPVGAALNAFSIMVQDHPQGEFVDYLSGTDFDAAGNSNMRWATTVGPHEIGDGAIAHVHARINAAHAIKFQASVAAGTATVEIKGILSQRG